MAISKEEERRIAENTRRVARAKEDLEAAEEGNKEYIAMLEIKRAKFKAKEQTPDNIEMIKLYDAKLKEIKDGYAPSIKRARKNLKLAQISQGNAELISSIAMDECKKVKGFEKMSTDEKAELFEKTREHISGHICIDYAPDLFED